MQLNESEKKVVEQMRRLDARWPKTRWGAVAIAILMATVGIMHFSNFPESPILLGLGIAQLYYVLKSWNDRRGTKLFIKLVAENEKDSK